MRVLLYLSSAPDVRAGAGMHAGPLTHGATGQVATGEEGYSSGAGAGAWLDDGTKGLDFTGNLECAAVDFATVHLCEPPDTRSICIFTA